MDQKQIEAALPADFEQAYMIYSKGANSKSAADLVIVGDLPFALTDGMTVTGQNSAGANLQGKVLGDYNQGPQDGIKVRIQYNVDTADFACRVGSSLTPVADGCKFFIMMWMKLIFFVICSDIANG